MDTTLHYCSSEKCSSNSGYIFTSHTSAYINIITDSCPTKGHTAVPI